MVTHTSTNQAQCRLTTLIEANVLTTTPQPSIVGSLGYYKGALHSQSICALKRHWTKQDTCSNRVCPMPLHKYEA